MLQDGLEVGDIIRRCRDILASKPNYTVCFVRRDSNKVAHVLARQSRLFEFP